MTKERRFKDTADSRLSFFFCGKLQKKMLSEYPNTIPLYAEPKEMLEEPAISNDTTLEEKSTSMSHLMKRSISLPHTVQSISATPEPIISDDEEESNDDDVQEEETELEPHPAAIKPHFGITVSVGHKVRVSLIVRISVLCLIC
jgi:hypothetical protein